MKYIAKVNCVFEIQVEDDDDIEIAKENIELDSVQNLLDSEICSSMQFVNVVRIKELKNS